MDFQRISRCVFLLLIVGLSVYFIYVNKNFKQGTEHFVEGAVTQKPTAIQSSVPVEKTTQQGAVNYNNLSENSDAQNIAIINDIYQDLFKEKPVDEEIKFYLEYLKSRNLTKQQLEDVIATTAPVLRKTIPDSSFKSTVAYGTEDAVILAYNEVLGRNPSDKELQDYAKKMSKEKEFTMERLIQLLVASQEYQRLEKMQLNTYNAGLLGGATDRQISMTIDIIYTDITGKELDSETKQFLKKKFIEFKLDETKMKSFIKNYVSGSSTCNTSESDTRPKLVLQEQLNKITDEQKQEKLTDEQKQDQQEKFAANDATDVSTKQASSSTESTAIAGSAPTTGQNPVYLVVPNQELINSLLQNMNKESDHYVDSQSVLDTINKKANCSFDKNAVNKQKNETLLSNEINNRNFEQLQSACKRNSAFLNADSEYVLRPDQKWSVPTKRTPVCNPSSKCQVTDSTDQTALIGTLINDAQKTSVGSILPYLPPR